MEMVQRSVSFYFAINHHPKDPLSAVLVRSRRANIIHPSAYNNFWEWAVQMLILEEQVYEFSDDHIEQASILLTEALNRFGIPTPIDNAYNQTQHLFDGLNIAFTQVTGESYLKDKVVKPERLLASICYLCVHSKSNPHQVTQEIEEEMIFPRLPSDDSTIIIPNNYSSIDIFGSK